MRVEDWFHVIDEGVGLGVRQVQFIGGEPTLHPGLAVLIWYALDRGLDVEVFSNLVHVDTELWAVFELPGVSLATSWYSGNEAEHNAITQRPSHAHTKANIAEAVRRGIPLRAGVIDLGGDQRVAECLAELAGLGVSRISYDRLREVGRGVRDIGASARQLCGGCGDGVAAVGPDGAVRPCVFARWFAPVGNVRDAALVDALAGMPAARAALLAQGMPVRQSAGPYACSPEDCSPCAPQGNCYPYNCHPRG